MIVYIETSKKNRIIDSVFGDKAVFVSYNFRGERLGTHHLARAAFRKAGKRGAVLLYHNSMYSPVVYVNGEYWIHDEYFTPSDKVAFKKAKELMDYYKV